MNNIVSLIKNLNKEQKEAVLSTEGPNLIVAGAGSGKTRVLTTRLIHIINEKKAWPNQILCVTFTNKAAKEMQNRVMQYVKGSSNAVPWLGTFHSISVKFLRRHAEALGYKSNFTILDTDDQKKLIRNIVKGEDLDAKKFSPQLIMYHIDQWKNKGLLPKDVKIEKSGSILKSILKVCGSISTNTNLQFIYEAGQADEIKLNGVVIISSSGLGLSARSERCKASVPEATENTFFESTEK